MMPAEISPVPSRTRAELLVTVPANVPPLPTCRVPAAIVVRALVFAPVTTSVPVPALVNMPAPEMTPESVRELGVVTVPPPAPTAMPRFVLAATPVDSSVPPLKLMLVPAPSVLLTPPLASVATLIVPALSEGAAVKLLVFVMVTLPVPVLVKAPMPAIPFALVLWSV